MILSHSDRYVFVCVCKREQLYVSYYVFKMKICKIFLYQKQSFHIQYIKWNTNNGKQSCGSLKKSDIFV